MTVPAFLCAALADACFLPLHATAQAARITQPLLLAYGAADRRVPLVHGKQLYAAVRQHNRDIEWVVYDEEGHGWTLPQNRIDFWGRVEKFLDRTIGKDSAPAKKE